jgi:tetratricopeptide (TPR) repeat protein
MTTVTHSWIQREAADEIFDKILSKPKGLVIYIINAEAGIGKTYLGRDIGTRLGSKRGYEAGQKNDIQWSGIVDLYDPDTSNSKRIEQRWMEAFSSLTGLEFNEYKRQRELYESRADQVSLPSEVEKQINSIRSAFVQGMEKAIKNTYPVMAFDTVERLQMVLDPAQQRLMLKEIDPSDVLDWLLYQVQHLSKGVILMLGRSTPILLDELKNKVKDFNASRLGRGLKPVEILEVSLKYLSQNEQSLFYGQRTADYPQLATLLDTDLRKLLSEKTKGNPLLMDIALQTLLETSNPEKVRAALNTDQGIEVVEESLLTAYMHEGTVERQNLLELLLIARNGLFDSLLKYLAPKDYDRLRTELTRMGELPFVKVRTIMAREPGQQQPRARLTYFLHDEMYTICDRIPIIGTSQIRESSAKIVRWYDEQVKKHLEGDSPSEQSRRPEAVRDLFVESLSYRMREDPKKGYRWYLEQSDRAIRNSERSLDLRLRDAMSIFMGSAGPKGQTGELPANAMDKEILIAAKSTMLKQDFQMDSTLHWIKRYSIRGRHEKALEIARKASWVEKNFKADRERYFATYAELRLWLGQSTMYAGKPVEALTVYNQIIEDLGKGYTPEAVQQKKDNGKLSPEDFNRICQVAGRIFNNRGYLYWMYFGMYWAAQEELFKAIDYFNLVTQLEEKANAQDNIGRVFAILGFDFQAFEAIGQGLDLRLKAGSPYREALSRNSLAIAYAQFDNVPQALMEVNGALEIFERIEIERGKALALITRGLAHRKQAELWRELRLSVEDAMELVQKAEDDLLAALAIFQEIVQEPIRDVNIYNEIGCCYRTRVMLRKPEKNSDEFQKALERGKRYFKLATEMSKELGFFIEYLDNLQDRAVLYFRAGELEKTTQDLETIRNLIPLSHKIKQGDGLATLEKTSRVDAHYKIMGQVELLAGGLVYDTAIQFQEKPDKDVVLEMLDHYVLAVAYFFVFSGKAFTNRQTNNRIYSRLKNCSREFLVELRDKHIPEIIKKYALPEETVSSQFDEVFSLLIPGSKIQSWEKSNRR